MWQILRLFFWSILENMQYWNYTWNYWNYTWNYWTYIELFKKIKNKTVQTFSAFVQNILNISIFVFQKWSTFFDCFQIFQKVFPRIPGGCMHKESDENRVLSIFYLSFGDIFVLTFLSFVVELCFCLIWPLRYSVPDIYTRGIDFI